MTFSYYRRLSAKDKRIYRKSDAVSQIALPHAARLGPLVAALRLALEADSRTRVEREVNRLSSAITRSLGVSGVRVVVLAKRPRRADGELHGLYTLEPNGRATIELWMRTAQHRRVVAFKTFFRTLLHELCHHLDIVLLELGETFHTEGFFRRESSLFRQLVPSEPAAARSAKKPVAERSGRKPESAAAPADRQLSLFG